MTLDYLWKRALAKVLASAEYGDVPLCYFWGAVMDELPEEYQTTDEKLMETTLQLLKLCLEEGYFVAGSTFPLGPRPPVGLSLEKENRWIRAHYPEGAPMFDWRPWDMGYTQAFEKIAREWKAVAQPFSSPRAMYGIVTLVPTFKAQREYELLCKELNLDQEKDEQD